MPVRFFGKNKIQGRSVVKLSIHNAGKSRKYPDGVKYGLICKDLRTGDFVLMDNDHPKGPNFNVNDREFANEYFNGDRLIDDYKMLVFKELGVKS